MVNEIKMAILSYCFSFSDAWTPNNVKKDKKHPSLNHTKNYRHIWEEEVGGEKDGYAQGYYNSDLEDFVDESEVEENGIFAAPEKEQTINLEDLLKVVKKAKDLSETSNLVSSSNIWDTEKKWSF